MVVESHEKCKFCSQIGKSESERNDLKKKIMKFLKNPDTDRLFEYFSLCLVSYQLNDSKNTKILALNSKQLYQEVTQKAKLPFNQWNKWLGDRIQLTTLESMYTKTTNRKFEDFEVKLYSRDKNFKIQDDFF